MAVYPRILGRTLDIVFWALLALVVITVLVATGVVIWANPDVNLAVPVAFVPDAGVLSLQSPVYGEGTIVFAQGTARFDEVGGPLHVIQALVLVAVFMVPAFVILHMLRRLVRSVAEGAPFNPVNAARIRVIGISTVLFELAAGLAAYWLQSSIAAQASARGMTLARNFSVNPAVIIIGLVIIALAEVFRYGSGLQHDADLTV